MEKAAAAQLGRLLERKREIVCISGFRSRKEQEELYLRSLEEHGEVFTNKYVAEPVSYTHLDVYKSQDFLWAACIEPFY